VEEEMLVIQERGGMMKPEQEDFLCSEAKMMTIHSISKTVSLKSFLNISDTFIHAAFLTDEN
jgi:hypothetical protein